MSCEAVEVLVIGGGQAGLAMSEHLSAADVPHLVLERDRIAERWRTGRWDSLVANGPAWHDRFPTLEFLDVGPDEFASKDQVVDYFVSFAKKISAPIRCGVEVVSARRSEGRPGFHVETTDGSIDARYLVAATGPFQRPVIPPIVPGDAAPLQMHSSAYRNPGQLPEGAVLVVGAGSSGVQIADELLASGRRVYLSVGPHDRPPRRYRGRDFCWWLGVLGKWDAETPPQGAEHVTIAVSGAHGGQTVDFRGLEARGMTLVGHDQLVRRRRAALRARPRREYRRWRRQLPLAAARGRRPRRAHGSRSSPRNPRPTSSGRCPCPRPSRWANSTSPPPG